MTKALRQAAWLLALLPVVAVGAESAKLELNEVLRAKANAVRGAGLFGQCSGCHGVEGNGDTNGSTPRIAGQHYRVIAKQLVDFRHGKRWDFRMEGMADQHHLATPADIADVAVYVAGLTRAGARGIGSGEFAEEGRRIYDAHCQACHGRDGDGDPSRGVPRLGGQHYGYLMRQMYDAVDGRRVTLPGLHSQRIAPLDFPQVRAVADYLSRIGWPPNENRDPPTRE
jgi:cytochrome c553